MGGGWITSLRWLAASALQNILQFFILIDTFENWTIFWHFDTSILALKRWNFLDNLDFKGRIVTKKSLSLNIKQYDKKITN